MEPTNAKYAPLNKSKRFAAGAVLVVDHGWTQANAAAEVGVSRPRLGPYVAQLREARQKKVDEAKEQLAGGVLRSAVSPMGLQEKRRVGTFEEFDDRYFGNWGCPDCDGRHHERPGFHSDIMQALEGPSSRLLINLPPYHAKSTLVTVKHTIYKIVENPNFRQIIVSKGLGFAKTFLQSINELLTNPELYEGAAGNLIQDWGPFKSDDRSTIWNTERIYVAGRVTAEKDPTIQCLGVGGQMYGRRADDIKFDDIADTDNQRNPDQVLKMLEWIDKMAASRVGKSGKLRWVGTRVGAGDVYSFLKGRPGYQVLRYPCILDDETEETLWGDHFPYSQALVHRSDMKPADFQLIYQNVDMPGVGASFPPELLENAKDTYRVRGQYESHWRLVAGLDLAGGNKGSGYTAMILKGVDLKTGKRFYVDIHIEKAMRAPQIKEKMLEWSSAYPIYEWRVEGNALQNQIIQYDQEIIRVLALKGTRVVQHTTHANKWDSQFGVEATAPLFHAGMESIPWGNAPSAQAFQPLIDQYIVFPMGAVSDAVMADWFTELGIRDLLRRAHMPQFDSRPVPKRIQRNRRVVDFNAGEIHRVPAHAQVGVGQLSIGQMNYRRMTVGRPTRHADVEDPGPPPSPEYVNVAGNVPVT